MRQTTLTGKIAPHGPRGRGIPKVAAILWIPVAPIMINRRHLRRYVRHPPWLDFRQSWAVRRARMYRHVVSVALNLESLATGMSCLWLSNGGNRSCTLSANSLGLSGIFSILTCSASNLYYSPPPPCTTPILHPCMHWKALIKSIHS